MARGSSRRRWRWVRVGHYGQLEGGTGSIVAQIKSFPRDPSIFDREAAGPSVSDHPSVEVVVGGPPPTGEMVVPKATPSQAKLTRWEYFCFTGFSANDVETKANKLGAEGWELVAAANFWCFKRAKI